MPDRNRLIFHIDVNSAFLSWTALERLAQGDSVDLRTIPAIVGGDTSTRHGVVLAKSIPAKAFGITTGEPVVNALRKCPHLVMASPDHSMYHEKSRLLMEHLSGICPDIEQVSIDECYMDMSDYFTLTHAQPYAVAKEIQDNILSTLSLPCSIGISPNKFLSKMASDMKKPLGITIITQRNLKEVLWPIKVGDMYGIGKKTTPKLEEVGIKTIADIANYDNYQTIRQFLGKNTLIYYNRANGRDLSPVVYEDTDMKSIGHSTTFESDISDEDSLKEEFKKVCLTVAERASKLDMYSNCVVITLKYTRFKSVTRQMLVQEYMNDYEKIYSYVMMLFNKHYTHEPLRLIGVTLNNVKRKEAIIEQMNIFDAKNEAVDPIDSLIENINKMTSAHLIKAKDYRINGKS